VTLRRLEVVRYTRTWRLPALLGVHGLVGFGAPILVRDEERLLRLGPGITVNRPRPGAIEGMVGVVEHWS